MKTKVKLYPEQKPEPQMWNYPDGSLSPKYNPGDFVYHNSFLVEIDEVKFNETRGYIYGLCYRTLRDGYITHGGGSFWWNESELTPVKDAAIVLHIERYRLQQKIKNLEHVASQSQGDLSAVEKSLSVLKRNGI